MIPDWLGFLTARGARVESEDRLRFDAPAIAPDAGDRCAIFDLSHLGLIAASGADAETFLQGQLTNDIRTLTPAHTHLSGHCSPKGRMLASFRVMRIGDAIVLQMPREGLAETLKRLRMYVLRSRVTLEDASDLWVRVGVAGTAVQERLVELGLSLPGRDNGLAETDGTSVLRLPAPLPRFELIGSVERLGALWDGLSPICRPGDADGWALLDIRAGLPTVYPATADALVPQMANMQLIDGVSFAKGCYTGQEVVARMQYLGRLKRRMYLAEVTSPVPPHPGDALQAPGSRSEQGAGLVVDARPLGGDRYALLAVVEIEAAERDEVRLGEQGPTLVLETPPYGFPAEPAHSEGGAGL
jgi:tRNA-modifying protein YgfZ